MILKHKEARTCWEESFPDLQTKTDINLNRGLLNKIKSRLGNTEKLRESLTIKPCVKASEISTVIAQKTV